MLRTFFFALGIFAALVGAELLLVDQAVLNINRSGPPTRSGWWRGAQAPPQKHVFTPPDWAGWTLLSAGAVTSMYSLALPKKKKAAG